MEVNTVRSPTPPAASNHKYHDEQVEVSSRGKHVDDNEGEDVPTNELSEEPLVGPDVIEEKREESLLMTSTTSNEDDEDDDEISQPEPVERSVKDFAYMNSTLFHIA